MFSLVILIKFLNILWRLLWLLLKSFLFFGINYADQFEVQLLGEHILREIDTHKAEALLFIWVVEINAS